MIKILVSVLLLAPLVGSADVTISTITPAAGLTRGGEFVHLHGSNLGQPVACDVIMPCPGLPFPTTVRFGDVFGKVVDITASEIVVLAPPHAAGPVDLELSVRGAAAVRIASGYFYQEAQSGDQVRLLIPVATSAPGALNSSWQTEVLVHNANAENLVIAGASAPQGDVAHGNSPATIPPFSTLPITFDRAGSNGAFVYIPRRLVDNVVVSVRVHETSRDGDSWGAEIPVVPETQFRRSVVLAGVPTDSRFRTLLRVYGYGVNDPTAVNVSLRDDVTGEFLGTNTLRLVTGVQDGTTAPLVPVYGQLPLEPILAPFAAKHARVRAEITPAAIVTSPIWGFVAITNNVTEQVTTISPATVLTAVAIPTASTLPLGHWGGVDACVDVTAAQVTLDLQCSRGTFPYPVIGSDGRFEADGMFQSFSGPVGNPVAVHYSGILQGSSLTLTIRFATSNSRPITVHLGSPGGCAGSPCPISDDP